MRSESAIHRRPTRSLSLEQLDSKNVRISHSCFGPNSFSYRLRLVAVTKHTRPVLSIATHRKSYFSASQVKIDPIDLYRGGFETILSIFYWNQLGKVSQFYRKKIYRNSIGPLLSGLYILWKRFPAFEVIKRHSNALSGSVTDRSHHPRLRSFPTSRASRWANRFNWLRFSRFTFWFISSSLFSREICLKTFSVWIWFAESPTTHLSAVNSTPPFF